MRIAIIGTGYVGLVSGACFAEFGVDVTCVDQDESKIAQMKAGEMPIYEPGLKRIVDKAVHAHHLDFTTDLAPSVAAAEVVFIAVGTPTRQGDGHADLKYVYEAAREIAKALDGYTVVATKSTVPVGTGAEVFRIIRELRPDADFDVVSNPEFLREGSAIEDFMLPDRIVIGTSSERAREVMRHLYEPLFYAKHTPIMMTSRETSELIKYASNAFLATKITFINQIADLCEALGCDVRDVSRGVGLDGRIGPKFLQPGPGYGGSCFPKDTLALARTAQEAGSPMSIVDTVITANSGRKRRMAEKIIKACGGSVAGKTIAVLGLTFKAETDDMRDSPSLVIVPMLQQAGAIVRAYDPEGMEEAQKQLRDIVWCETAYDCIGGADALAILTDWNRFRALDLSRVKQLLRKPVIIDLRNIYDPQKMAAAGFVYTSVGQKTIDPAELKAVHIAQRKPVLAT